LIKGDCLEELPRLKEKIDLVLVDLPYGQTACKWDSLIDLDKMWIELKKICKRDCIYVFFCTTKFGYKLIQSNERWFRYDLVWEKSRKVGFLSANKMPLRKHEMVYVFKEKQGTYHPQKTEGEPYNKGFISNIACYGETGEGKTYLAENKTGDRYPTSILQFPNDFEYQNNSNHEMVYVFKEKQGTYNPQKTEGESYKRIRKNETNIYGENIKLINGENKSGDRYPTSILQFDSLDLVEPNNDNHEMVYVFKDKQGTYNPQKTEGKPYKHSGIRSSNLYTVVV
jgi:hypothetical protein